MPLSPVHVSRGLVLRALTIAMAGGGWMNLARGSTTAAPVLLVLAYLVLVPMVIRTWR